MNLSWAGGWQAVTIAVALIVGGAAIMAPQADQSAHLFRWLGYGLLVVGCLVFVASMFLLHRMARRRHRALWSWEGVSVAAISYGAPNRTGKTPGELVSKPGGKPWAAG
jgi:hypothetical protein